jgi:hypothetical protein
MINRPSFFINVDLRSNRPAAIRSLALKAYEANILREAI